MDVIHVLYGCGQGSDCFAGNHVSEFGEVGEEGVQIIYSVTDYYFDYRY